MPRLLLDLDLVELQLKHVPIAVNVVFIHLLSDIGEETCVLELGSLVTGFLTISLNCLL